MDKLQGMIIHVLTLLERPVYRTEIVKFIYMIDEMYYRHFGKTISGMRYKWDNYGPNSVDDGIVNTAEQLVSQGILHMSPAPNQYGETIYLYSVENHDEQYISQLSDGEKYVIQDITCHYKNHELQDLIQASKQTVSFQGVRQYEAIDMKQSEKYLEIIKSLKADEKFESGVEAVEKEMVV